MYLSIYYPSTHHIFFYAFQSKLETSEHFNLKHFSSITLAWAQYLFGYFIIFVFIIIILFFFILIFLQGAKK